ncbi:MAG: glycosylhydrolase-like jelly roll fold domain-containing protein, partial [Terracidiphilus sp.]
MRAEADTARLKEISQALFHGSLASAHFVADETALGADLAKELTPDMKLEPATPQIGFIHRKLRNGDLYFVANTANETKHVHAQFRDAARHAEIWDGFTGEITALPDPKDIELDFEAYGSRLIFFSDAASTATQGPARHETVKADLSREWKVTFGDSGLSKQMDRLASWSDDAATKYYSGRATYEKSFELPAPDLAQGSKYLLDFGAAAKTPIPSPPGEHNMRAYLDAPVRDAAEVYVNGKLAGVVWRPPYRIDVTAQLHAGTNELRIVVGNTAINELAGRALPDYRLLWDRYGRLFEPQDMHDLQPLPSGVLGPVTLIESDVAK